MLDFSNTSAPLPRIDATGFEPAVSAPLRSVQSQGPPDLVNLCVPNAALYQTEPRIYCTKKTGTFSLYQTFQRPCQESMRQDLNLRPLRPERSALPN